MFTGFREDHGIRETSAKTWVLGQNPTLTPAVTSEAIRNSRNGWNPKAPSLPLAQRPAGRISERQDTQLGQQSHRSTGTTPTHSIPSRGVRLCAGGHSGLHG